MCSAKFLCVPISAFSLYHPPCWHVVLRPMCLSCKIKKQTFWHSFCSFVGTFCWALTSSAKETEGVIREEMLDICITVWIGACVAAFAAASTLSFRLDTESCAWVCASHLQTATSCWSKMHSSRLKLVTHALFVYLWMLEIL